MPRFLSAIIVSVVTCVAGALLPACEADDCEKVLECTGGGPGAGGSGGGTPAECVPTAGQSVGDECGVFVSSSMANGPADGTKAHPYPTVSEAIGKATRVYVCAETTPYEEEVSITTAGNIYGGLDCANAWRYDAAKPTRVAPPLPGIPLRISEVAGTVSVEDFHFQAADAMDPGASSIGAFVHASANVSLRRVRIAAGIGADGASGSMTPFTYPMKSTLDGKPAMGATGGQANVCVCPAGDQSSGGLGGNETPGGQAGGTGLPANGGGAPGQPGSCATIGTGGDGLASPNAADGEGANVPGSLSVAGWEPAAGSEGMPGGPGQGGGGGASDIDGSGAGGGGGCGGCGGAPGMGGSGGGASIALLILDSLVIIDGGELSAMTAGAGGDGAAGQSGQTQFGDGGLQTPGGCPGGAGAPGASGGAGGGGAGGVSAGVLFKGRAPPTVTGATITTDLAGAGGLGGEPGVNDGIDGVACGQLSLDTSECTPAS